MLQTKGKDSESIQNIVSKLEKSLKMLQNKMECAPSIPGFRFPIFSEADVTRLENAVRRSPKIKQQYVSFSS